MRPDLISRGLLYILALSAWLGEWAGALVSGTVSPTALRVVHAREATVSTGQNSLQSSTQPYPSRRSGPLPLQQDEPAPLLLPDLQTLPPSNLYIETLPDGNRALRLANTIWNSGQGPLELSGQFNPVSRQTRVYQRVYASNGALHEHLVGEFVWHPGHDHWHFEDFTIYELWSLQANGGLQEVVSSSDKLSYCVIDTNPVDRQLPAFEPRQEYRECGEDLQGLSVGWGDRYKSSLDGQSIDLAGVPDGYYALKSTANPAAILLEEDYSNNSAALYLEIQAGRVRLIQPGELFSEKTCFENCSF